MESTFNGFRMTPESWSPKARVDLESTFKGFGWFQKIETLRQEFSWSRLFHFFSFSLTCWLVGWLGWFNKNKKVDSKSNPTLGFWFSGIDQNFFKVVQRIAELHILSHIVLPDPYERRAAQKCLWSCQCAVWHPEPQYHTARHAQRRWIPIIPHAPHIVSSANKTNTRRSVIVCIWTSKGTMSPITHQEGNSWSSTRSWRIRSSTSTSALLIRTCRYRDTPSRCLIQLFKSVALCLRLTKKVRRFPESRETSTWRRGIWKYGAKMIWCLEKPLEPLVHHTTRAKMEWPSASYQMLFVPSRTWTRMWQNRKQTLEAKHT